MERDDRLLNFQPSVRSGGHMTPSSPKSLDFGINFSLLQRGVGSGGTSSTRIVTERGERVVWEIKYHLFPDPYPRRHGLIFGM